MLLKLASSNSNAPAVLYKRRERSCRVLKLTLTAPFVGFGAMVIELLEPIARRPTELKEKQSEVSVQTSLRYDTGIIPIGSRRKRGTCCRTYS